MLTLTEEAASAVQTIISTAELPAGGGMRISRAEASEQGAGEEGVTLRMSLVEEPAEGDQLAGDERVFVAAETAPLLDDMLLDAEIVENQVRFSLAAHPDADPESG